MKPETLSAALRAHREILAEAGADPNPPVIVDGHPIGLSTALLLAAENLDRGAKYDALVAHLSKCLGTEYAAELVAAACATD